jgi:hypothetical protein
VSKKLCDEYGKLLLKRFDLTVPNADPEAGPSTTSSLGHLHRVVLAKLQQRPRLLP